MPKVYPVDIKHKAQQLRSGGYSLSQITSQLGIAKSTASLWLKHTHLSQRATSKVALRHTKRSARGRCASKMWFAHRREKILRDSKAFSGNVLRGYSPDRAHLIVILSMLYLCEGSKSSSFTFTNSDPALIKFYLFLLRTCFKLDEEKLRIGLHLHEGFDERQQLNFWSKISSIPRERFYKTFWKKAGKIHKNGYRGCARVYYCDVTLRSKLLSVAETVLQWGELGR